VLLLTVPLETCKSDITRKCVQSHAHANRSTPRSSICHPARIDHPSNPCLIQHLISKIWMRLHSTEYRTYTNSSCPVIIVRLPACRCHASAGGFTITWRRKSDARAAKMNDLGPAQQNTQKSLRCTRGGESVSRQIHQKVAAFTKLTSPADGNQLESEPLCSLQ
jgi:hypothetical protein